MKTVKLLLILIILLLSFNSYACKNTPLTNEYQLVDESINEHHLIFKAYNYTHNLLTLESDCGGFYTFQIKFTLKEVKQLKRCDFYIAYDNDELQKGLQYIIADYYNKTKDETVLVYKY